MAGKRLNHTLALIQKMRSEMAEGFADLRREMGERFAQVDARISKLDSDTTAGFQRVVNELQSHRAWAVDKLRDHEQRITVLETKGSGE